MPVTQKAPPNPYRLQEQYAMAAAEFDKNKATPRRQVALRKMAKALQQMGEVPRAKLHFDPGAYRDEYERRLAKLTGVRVSAPKRAPKKKKAPSSPPAPKKRAAKKKSTTTKKPSKKSARRR